MYLGERYGWMEGIVRSLIDRAGRHREIICLYKLDMSRSYEKDRKKKIEVSLCVGVCVCVWVCVRERERDMKGS